MPAGPHRRLAVLTAAALGAAGLTASALPAAAADPAAPVPVTVDVRAGLATVPETGLGVNDAIWDTELGSAATSALLKEPGVKMVRYPGGSYADIYHWKDHTAPGGYVAPNTDFDTYMASLKAAGAKPIVIANYGTGTAQEAADWVAYANRTKRYGVKYWEIGNENYGNGHYGSAWEADDHEDLSPTAYANGVVEYARAMKAVDPSIKVGAVLTTPGNWPDGIVADGDSATWNETVLSIAGPSVDFVILHWYPGGSVAQTLAAPQQATDITELTRAQLTRFAGPRADRIQIAMTEVNAGASYTTQPGAIFAADAYASLWGAGVVNVDWWNVRNGMGTVSTVAGQTDFNDWGLFSSGTCSQDGTTCEPPLNTPFAPYRGLQMLDRLADPGDQLVRVTTGDPLVTGHAVRRPDGKLSVLLLNKDPDNARTVSIAYSGFAPAPGRPAVRAFLNGAAAITTVHTGTATSQTLPAYSLTSLLLDPTSRPALVAAPGTPTVGAVTDSRATVTWPAVPHAAGYDVYLQGATGSTRAARTTTTSADLTGLALGTRYTVTVVARDRSGSESWSSPPAAFVTGTPASSTCSVHLTKGGDWGNGYVGSLDVTNPGTDAVDGWTLGFTFPRSWLSFGSGWNATWAADGADVTATNVDWNASIAPGATVNIGYVGNYAGPNVLPGVFTLNGTVCTTT
ncbi:alpha-L-arabinofuranosidase [Cellulomonas chitinilytica]|uniref:Alpha-L-arabinofuranosidase n=1 Tax=Cellulomonas chitinilytica TaxID=398759 RepID=A0A919P5G8_9CELL|nr:cellulose binding domain-containing protein [Cellulomonas chitinilytica]GIG23598.1 alpha-L-arabinofuranosidase [Cellulomonas chitinilytica]